MLRFALSRLGTFIPTFLGVTFIAFMFIRVLPGDPVITMNFMITRPSRSAVSVVIPSRIVPV